MEATEWTELLPEDDDDGGSCLSREVCVEELLQDAPAGCLFCRLGELDEGEGE